MFRETGDEDTVRRAPIAPDARSRALDVGREAMTAAQEALVRVLAGRPTWAGRPSTLIVAGMAVNQVGGSMIAVSCAGNAPTIGLFGPPSLFHWTIPLRPFPVRLAAVRPVTNPAEVRKLAPFVRAPTYPPPAAKKACSR